MADLPTRAPLIAFASMLLSCGSSASAPISVQAPEPAPWPRGAPVAPPCSSATTRADCVTTTAPICNPARWLSEGLARLAPAAHIPCEGNATHVVTLPGTTAATEAELLALKRRAGDLALAFPGARAVGVGVCCAEMSGARCLSIFVDPCGPPIDELAHRASALVRRDPLLSERMVQLRIQLTHPGPRCQPNDPQCTALSFGATVSPDQDRYPIAAASSACSHDGECTIGGCREDCVAWTEAARQWICAAGRSSTIPNWPRACGCVANGCRWFEQDVWKQ